MVFVLGLTGNIACGKSTVGRYLAERYGADYLDADGIVHDLYRPDGAEARAIVSRFGPDIVGPSGAVDRRRLGDLVMGDPAARTDLEAILHPAVIASVDRRIAETPARVLVVDAILLIESGLASRCHAIWVVVCKRQVQIARLIQHRRFTREDAELRVKAQAPPEGKLAHAKAILENDGGMASFEARIADAWTATVAPRLSPARGA